MEDARQPRARRPASPCPRLAQTGSPCASDLSHPCDMVQCGIVSGGYLT